MVERELYQASKGWLKSTVDALCAAGIEVVAPTETEQGVELASVSSSEAVILPDGKVPLPLKRFFMPPTEVLLDFEKHDDGEVDVVPALQSASGDVVIIGSRPCDAAALEVLDKVFHWDYDDLLYRARRERTTVVTLACTEPSPECFCTSVGGSPHDVRQSDVLVFVFGRDPDGALMQVLTAKGQKFIERLGDVVGPVSDGAQAPSVPELQTKFDPEKGKQWLDENFESDFWTENSLACLGCGACSYLCPTCHCFDIVDEAAWNRGQRRRNWDCCSFALFTQHASGHNPRPNQAARYRQRIMHKFKYFPERFGQIACVGCGRCIRTCGVGQNLIAAMADIESR